MLLDCPHCMAKCQFNAIGNETRCDVDGFYQNSWQCQNCHGFVVTKRQFTNSLQGLLVMPSIKIKPRILIDKLPDKIRNGYLESLEDYSNGCYISSVIMCRRTIQEACLDRGATKPTLFEQIEELNIEGSLKKLAHKLRFWGNKGAHPDILLNEEIEEKDAKIAINFTEKFLQYIYIIPKEIEEIEGKIKED